MMDLDTKLQIKAIYNAGEEAVITLVLGLLEKTFQLEHVIKSQEERIKALEEKLKKDSRNSNKPPSSDGLKRKPKGKRPKSNRKTGGQKGHKGSTLNQVDNPDHVHNHTLDECSNCQCSLQDSLVLDHKKRQVFDVPPLALEVYEHRAEVKKCPRCGVINTATFPESVLQVVQYGARIKSLVVYLMQYQLLPSERTTELIKDLFSHPISEGTLFNWNQAAYQTLEKTEAEIKQQLLQSPVNHFDETGMFCENKLNWLHVVSNPALTYFEIHPKRGQEAINTINILPHYKGTAVHDFWKPYLKYNSNHSMCNAHLLRELTALYESKKQKWSTQIQKLLVTIKKRVEHISQQANSLDPTILRKFELEYDKLVSEGLNLNPVKVKKAKKRGRQKQSEATNLLLRLKNYRSYVLAFMYDFRVPFTNNLAERDLRMAKVKQKISGTFRSRDGANIFCRVRGFIATAKKNDLNIMDSISQVFEGTPPSFNSYG